MFRLADALGQRAGAGGLGFGKRGEIGGTGVKAAEKAGDFTAEPQGGGFALGRQVGLLDLAGARFYGAHLPFRLLLGVLGGCGDFLWRGELAIPGVNAGAEGRRRRLEAPCRLPSPKRRTTG